MAVTVTLEADRLTLLHGTPVIFSGQVLEDGVPRVGLTINVFRVKDALFLVGAETDVDGFYAVSWTPSASFIGSFQVHTLAAAYAGYYSAPIQLTVTGEVPPQVVTPMVLVALASALGLVLTAISLRGR